MPQSQAYIIVCILQCLVIFTHEHAQAAHAQSAQAVQSVDRRVSKHLRQSLRPYESIADKLIIRKLPFQRMVRELIREIRPDFRCQSTALLLLQEAAEAYIISLMRDANFSATLAQRACVTIKDFRLANRVLSTL